MWLLAPNLSAQPGREEDQSAGWPSLMSTWLKAWGPGQMAEPTAGVGEQVHEGHYESGPSSDVLESQGSSH